jgi:small subunit ribosomal protein S16
MPVKIRLARHGRRNRPYYHIVVADSRSPRDGRFIEKIGIYNTLSNPAKIELDFDKALNWLQNGAQPTDTCRSILSVKGVMIKKHLLDGVKKKALTEEQAEQKFEAWMKEKEVKIQSDLENMSQKKDSEKKKIMDSEVKKREAKAAIVAQKLAQAAKAAAAVTIESSVTPENTETAAQ